MNESLEAVSALMDGEVDELELRRLLKAECPEARQAWSRYHAQSDALRGTPPPFAQFDISGRVRESIAAEPLVKSSRFAQAWRPLGGVGVAAAVAALVVFGVGTLDMRGGPATEASGEFASGGSRVFPTPVGAGSGSVTATAPAGSIPTLMGTEASEARERFEYYLQRHTERAAENSGQGMMTYTRAVNQGDD